MILRKNFLPKRISEAATTLFVLFIIPVVYYFELFIVLPEFYVQWSAWYIFHFTLGTYILANIISNYWGILLCDTSIRGRLLEPPLDDDNWRLCSVCETMVPPRSWHCKTCNICILKRDHHCMFTGCCVGHFNLRYFLMFVFYLFVATVYATCYNVVFIYHNFNFEFTWTTLMYVVFPFATLFVKWTAHQLYLTLVIIVIIGSLFAGFLLFFHSKLMLKGRVTKENDKKINSYDRGVWKNIEEVLGEKWHLVWISPFVESHLPQDGINWVKNSTDKAK